MTRVRGYAPWRPQAKSRILLAQVQAVLAEYAAYLPLTIRQVFYRLRSTRPSGHTTVLRFINRPRRADLMDWDAIRDDGSQHVGWNYTRLSRSGFLHWMMPDPYDADSYRLDPQTGQPQRIEVSATAAGMVPMLSQVTQPYGVPVYSSSRVSTTTTFKRAASLRAADTPGAGAAGRAAHRRPRPEWRAPVQLRRRGLRRDGVGGRRGDRVRASRRAARTHRSVRSGDRAAQEHRQGASSSGRTVQAEALPPDVLSNLLGLAIAEFWDDDAAQHVRDRQNDDQQWLRERFAAVGQGLTDVLDELDDEQ